MRPLESPLRHDCASHAIEVTWRDRPHSGLRPSGDTAVVIQQAAFDHRRIEIIGELKIASLTISRRHFINRRIIRPLPDALERWMLRVCTGWAISRSPPDPPLRCLSC